ncbi:MAG: hypothetical protein QM809_10260 [Gordonia sp. (in: high G+C Gram-positive bacteria)]
MTPRGACGPSQAHLDFRKMQEERVFGLGAVSSNEGLEGSEHFIGAR